jgi:methionyl-tRNA synthetase
LQVGHDDDLSSDQFFGGVFRGDAGDEERTIVAGIAAKYTPEELVGRKIVIVANLQPAKLMGVESNGMVLAASIDGEPSLLSVDAAVPAGTKIK